MEILLVGGRRSGKKCLAAALKNEWPKVNVAVSITTCKSPGFIIICELASGLNGLDDAKIKEYINGKIPTVIAMTHIYACSKEEAAITEARLCQFGVSVVHVNSQRFRPNTDFVASSMRVRGVEELVRHISHVKGVESPYKFQETASATVLLILLFGILLFALFCRLGWIE